MGYKILGGTQANWAISIIDGYYKISDHLNRFIDDEIRNKFVILWAWQTEKGLDNIESSVKGDEIFFMTDKSKAEIIGCGRWLKKLPHENLTDYWKNEPQWQKKWEYPYLLEVTCLDNRLLKIIKSLTPEEREVIVKDKVVDRRRLFSALGLITIPNPDGGAIWETSSSPQNSEIEHAKTYFVNPFARGEHPSFWWVCQGESYTADRGKQYLWAPHKDKSGKTPSHWSSMERVVQGDIIFNYANNALQGVSMAKGAPFEYINDQSQWEKEGIRVDIEHYDLSRLPLPHIKKRFNELKQALKDISNQPFDVNGDVKQGYLFDFNLDAGKIIRNVYGKPFPDPIEIHFPLMLPPKPSGVTVEGLLMKKKQIILYGPPGTGKTYSTKTIALSLLQGN